MVKTAKHSKVNKRDEISKCHCIGFVIFLIFVSVIISAFHMGQGSKHRGSHNKRHSGNVTLNGTDYENFEDYIFYLPSIQDTTRNPFNFHLTQDQYVSKDVLRNDSAAFGVYIRDDFEPCFEKWLVRFQQDDWNGHISYKHPQHDIYAYNRSGYFSISVISSGQTTYRQRIPVQDGYTPQVGVNLGCLGLIILYAEDAATCQNLGWYPVYDAFCLLS